MITHIIAIAGPSGSGKTFLAQALPKSLQETAPSLTTAVLSEDSYYRDLSHLPKAERDRNNFDEPAAFEHDLLLAHIKDIKAGKAIDVPLYDFAEHIRTGIKEQLHPTELLIVEGILLFSHAQLRREFDLRLFMDTPIDVCFARRMKRDCIERGRSEASVQRQFKETVLPMYHEHVAPTKEYAHLVLSGEDPIDSLTNRVQNELKQRGYLQS